MKHMVWMVIGVAMLIALVFAAGVYLVRMRPDSGKSIRWQGHETGYTNATQGGPR